MNAEDDKLRKIFGIPEPMGFECDYKELECDNRMSDGRCGRNDEGADDYCPGEEEAEEDEEGE